MDTGSFIVYVKTDGIYKDIAEDVEIRFDNSNYELDILLPKGKNKTIIGLMKDELDGKIMKEFLGLRAKYVIKRKLKLKNYKNCLKATQLENKINQLEQNKVNTESLRENHNEFIKNNKLLSKTQQRIKNEKHNVFTEKI